MKTLNHSQFWKEAPFFRLLIPLIAGILLQYFFPITKSRNGLVLICSAFVLLFSLFMRPNSLFGWGWMIGISIQLIFLSFGRWLLVCQRDITVSGSFPNDPPRNGLLMARLENDPEKRARSFKCLATIQDWCSDRRCILENEKILLYLQTDRLPDKMGMGAVLVFQKPLLPIENMGAFAGFDYKRYCERKHLHAQVFLRTGEYSWLGEEKNNLLKSGLNAWRKKLLGILKQYIPGKEENGLLEALMIGYTNDLDRELIQSYSNTGVVHIIAISGLHLTLIYQILQLLLQRIKGQKSGKWIKLGLLLGALWSFSLLSGASPSVIRSAVMFSFLLLGRNLSRTSVMYNTLASSAFLLLCFDPFWIWDTGFQLSYAAVFSLVIFVKPVQGLFPLKNKLLAALWNSAAVSLAAQILTTPMSVFYFHRFPNYFLFCNLLAVPLSSCILVGGILLCLFSFSPVLAQPISWLLSKGIGFLNGFIQYIAHLPGAVTDQLRINFTQMIFLYILIGCGYHFFRTGGKRWLISAQVSVLIFLFLRIFASGK
jgi:competence protein ComEC